MSEQYKEHLSQTPETKMEVAETTSVENTLPDIKDLDALLNESEKVVAYASISEEEIDEAIEKRERTLGDLQNMDAIREERLHQIKNYTPLENLTPTDYDRLVHKGIIDSEYAGQLKKFDDIIASLESLDYPTAEAAAELEKLSQIRNSLREKLDGQIKEDQQELSEQREEDKSRVLEDYVKRVEELEKVISDIESNPKVLEKLYTMAEQDRKKFEEKIGREREKIIAEATGIIQSLSTMHLGAFKRLSEIVGNENIANELLDSLENETAQEQQDLFNDVQNSIIKSIIEGENEQQLKVPKEIVPWAVYPTSIQYIDAVNTLRSTGTTKALQDAAETDDERTNHLLNQQEQVLTENWALRKLVGKKWIADRKTGKKHLGTFWSAFETRKENDKKGITEARKQEREDAAGKEDAFQKNAGEIVTRGGFVVEVPIYKQIHGKRQEVGKEKGVVRLEKATSKKGNDYWKVVELFGMTEGIKVGDTAPLNMGSFPEWLRENAKKHFVMHGEDFVERLVY